MLFSLFWTAFLLIVLSDVLSLTAILSQPEELNWENNHTSFIGFYESNSSLEHC